MLPVLKNIYIFPKYLFAFFFVKIFILKVPNLVLEGKQNVDFIFETFFIFSSSFYASFSTSASYSVTFSLLTSETKLLFGFAIYWPSHLKRFLLPFPFRDVLIDWSPTKKKGKEISFQSKENHWISFNAGKINQQVEGEKEQYLLV